MHSNNDNKIAIWKRMEEGLHRSHRHNNRHRCNLSVLATAWVVHLHSGRIVPASMLTVT
jgi:hypothetical protein